MLPRVPPSPRRGETGRHPCGAPQARLMAFGRQGVTGAERSRDGTARFDRLGESYVEKPRDDDTLADGSTCGGAIGRSRPRDPPTPGETEPNRSDRVPCCGREAPPFTTGEDVTRIQSQIRSVLIITTMADLDLCNSYLNGYIRLKG